MKIGNFARLVAIGSTVAIGFAVSGPSTAAYEEGKHYFKLENPMPGKGEQVKVVEFFNFACPHCYNLEPHITQWSKKDKADYITFSYVPAFWNDLFKNTAKAFYVAEALDKLDTLKTPIFEAIHKKGVDFTSVANIKAVFVENGVDAKEFDKQFNSFFVSQRMSMANKLFAQYKLRSVPAIVVDGTWRTSVQDAGSTKALFEIIEELAEKAKSSRTSK